MEPRHDEVFVDPQIDITRNDDTAVGLESHSPRDVNRADAEIQPDATSGCVAGLDAGREGQKARRERGR